MKIRTKLIVAFSALLLLSTNIGHMGYRTATAIQKELHEIFSVYLPSIDYLIEADRDLQQLLVAERSMIFTDAGSQQFKALVKAYEENLQQSAARWDKYKATTQNPEEKALFQKFETARSEWSVISRQIVDARSSDTPEGRSLAMDLSLGRAGEKFESMREIINTLTDINQKASEAANENAEHVFKSLVSALVSVILLGVVLGAGMAWFIIKSLTTPISKSVDFANRAAVGNLQHTLELDQRDEIGVLAEALKTMVHNLRGLVLIAEKIAGGDLTVTVTPLSEHDALGHALKNMVEKLSTAMAEINMSAQNVSAGAAQMNSTSQAMSQGATEQASSLEEISSSMNEIAAQTRQNAENATLANRLSGDTKILAENGNEQMQHMVEAMKEINHASQNISRIIKVIDEIAFQTNLLALNAAVEAARAGKHGKGFAVVAEEVRNLAARSAKAAKETADLIENSVKKVDDGTDIADKTAEALTKIVEAAAKVSALVAEIASASNEQAQGAAQITAGLGQVDQVTHQNTAHAEESASAAEELSSQAMVLQHLVAAFRVKGQAAPAQEDTAAVHGNRGRMLTVGKSHEQAPRAGSKTSTPWGGSTVKHKTAQPEIFLDDRGFGKY